MKIIILINILFFTALYFIFLGYKKGYDQATIKMQTEMTSNTVINRALLQQCFRNIRGIPL